MTCHGLVAPSVGEVGNECHPGLAVHHSAQARGEPGHSPTGVGRAVEGVDDHRDALVVTGATRLLADHPDSCGGEDAERRLVGHQVGGVLTALTVHHRPVGDPGHRVSHGVGDVAEQDDEPVVGPGTVWIGVGHTPTVPGAGTRRRPRCAGEAVAWQAWVVAVIDIPGFVADLKSHAVDHGFHVHDERHFIETYSLRQMWEVELHPEQACGGPLDLHLALEVDPRALLQFEDRVVELDETDEPPTGFWFPLAFNWALPPLPAGPDLLVLATELAEIGGTELPLEVSAIDSYATALDAPERSLSIVARIQVPLDRILLGQEQLCDVLDRCHGVSMFLLDRAPMWLDDL